jgi:hypothetical protein
MHVDNLLKSWIRKIEKGMMKMVSSMNIKITSETSLSDATQAINGIANAAKLASGLL